MRTRPGLVLIVVAVAAAAMFAKFARSGSSLPRRERPPDTAPDKGRTQLSQPSAPSPEVVKVVSVPYPQLLESGFEGMSLEEMASHDDLERAFPGITDVAAIYSRDLKAYKVEIEEPGIRTVHGLSVGMPLDAVLKLQARHHCEKVSSVISSAQVSRAIRCWVGKKPARFRYVASLPDRSFEYYGPPIALYEGSELSDPHEGPIDPVDDIPDGGKALDRWLVGSRMKIDLILWRNDLEDER